LSISYLTVQPDGLRDDPFHDFGQESF